MGIWQYQARQHRGVLQLGQRPVHLGLDGAFSLIGNFADFRKRFALEIAQDDDRAILLPQIKQRPLQQPVIIQPGRYCIRGGARCRELGVNQAGVRSRHPLLLPVMHAKFVRGDAVEPRTKGDAPPPEKPQVAEGGKENIRGEILRNRMVEGAVMDIPKNLRVVFVE